jgi:hypothetical protein
LRDSLARSFPETVQRAMAWEDDVAGRKKGSRRVSPRAHLDGLVADLKSAQPTLLIRLLSSRGRPTALTATLPNRLALVVGFYGTSAQDGELQDSESVAERLYRVSSESSPLRHIFRPAGGARVRRGQQRAIDNRPGWYVRGHSSFFTPLTRLARVLQVSISTHIFARDFRCELLRRAIPAADRLLSSISGLTPPSARPAVLSPLQALKRLLIWFCSYSSLFSAPCAACAKRLVQPRWPAPHSGSTQVFDSDRHKLLPPTVRTLLSGQALHPECYDQDGEQRR